MVKILAIIDFIKSIPTLIKEFPGIVKILNKCWNIIKGWYYKIFNKHEELAIKRISICNACKSKKYVEKLGDICAECGCVLSAKTRVKDEHCILNKW